MEFKLLLVAALFMVLTGHSNAIKCYNCYSPTGDLRDCQSYSVETLGAKLTRDSKLTDERSHSALPAFTVANDADACVKFSIEYVTPEGTIRHAVVRTQILKLASSYFAYEDIPETCDLQTDLASNFRRFKSQYCACTTNFCNGSKRNSFKSSATLIILSSLFVCTFSPFLSLK